MLITSQWAFSIVILKFKPYTCKQIKSTICRNIDSIFKLTVDDFACFFFLKNKIFAIATRLLAIEWKHCGDYTLCQMKHVFFVAEVTPLHSQFSSTAHKLSGCDVCHLGSLWTTPAVHQPQPPGGATSRILYCHSITCWYMDRLKFCTQVLVKP